MFVYILRSCSCPNQTYVGITSNIDLRLQQHNSGISPHTAKYVPWKVEIYFWVSDKNKAFQFEKYLKSGSGRAFRQKHF